MFRQETVTVLRILAALVALAALAAAAAGVLLPALYRPVVPQGEMPAVFGQDLVTAAAALLLLVMGTRRGVKSDMLRIGLIGYLFYAYGMYAIGLLYSVWYFLYLVVFGLAIFYFILAFTGIDYAGLKFSMPAVLRYLLAAYCAFIAVYFAPQWIGALLHLIRSNARPAVFGFMPAVYILDLCFVLPLCALTAIMLLRKQALGFVLGGALAVKGFVLMLSVAAGFYCQPLFRQAMAAGDALEFTALWAGFLVLCVFVFAFTRLERTGETQMG